MSEFDFSAEDLMDFGSDPFMREQKKNLPTDKAMATSRSKQNTGSDLASAEMSTLATGQILMGQPLYDDADNVVAKHDKIMSSMLGVAIQADDQHLGKVFQEMTPSNVMTDVAKVKANEGKSLEETGGTTQAPGTAAGGAPSTGSISDGNGLIATGNILFSDGDNAKGDMAAGKFSPNLMFNLGLLTTQFAVTITAGAGPGHTTNSLHYKHQAVDIGSIKDLSTGQTFRIAGPHPMIKKFLDLLITVTGPRRADEVISPMDPGIGGVSSGFWSQQDHQDHIHLGCEKWGDPLPPPVTSGRGTPSASGGTIGN